jgi:pyruvate formate lyase activating enzyme
MTLSAVQRISCDVVETHPDVARIFNIQRYSLNDGRGIRTVVFLKAALTAVRGVPILNQFHPKLRRCVGRANVCIVPPACGMPMSARLARLSTPVGMSLLDELERQVMKDDIFFRSSGGGSRFPVGKC